MRKAFGILSLMASLAVIGCANSTTGPGGGTPPGGGGTPHANITPATGPGAINPENTKITFVGTKKGGKHDGGFKMFAGHVKPPTGDVTKSTITVEIDAESLWTDADSKLGDHLKSPDFFDVKKHPSAKFVSKEIKAEAKGDFTHVITGDLTLHGTTKPITFPVKIKADDATLQLDSGDIKIDRTDYGISFKPEMVDKDVTIKVSLKTPRK